MPITCSKQNKSQDALKKNDTQSKTSGLQIKKQTNDSHTANYIQRLFNSVNRAKLISLIEESCDKIVSDFFALAEQYAQRDTAIKEMNELKEQLSQMPHVTLLAMFFALLNIDCAMKEKLIDCDVPSNNRKLTRFYLDLNRIAVAKFFSDESMHPRQFVEMCEELYVLA